MKSIMRIFLMETAYFVKVTDSMSWNQLNEKIEKLKRKGIKPLRFITVAKIVVSSKDFDNLAISIKKYNTLYAPYTHLSVPTNHGIWNCILLMCFGESRNILIYTAGNLYPLYASILNF